MLRSISFPALASQAQKVRSARLMESGCLQLFRLVAAEYCATPNIEVDPETYEVRVDGKMITCEPAGVLPLAQRYFLF